MHYLLAVQKQHLEQLVALAGNIPKQISDSVWEQSGGHPFLAQFLLHRIFELTETKNEVLNISDLVDTFLTEYGYHFEGWCQAIGKDGLRTYEKLAAEFEWRSESTLLSTLRMDSLKLKDSLVTLCYHGIVIQDGYWRQYKAPQGLFKSWFDRYGATFTKTYPIYNGEIETMYELSPEIRVQAAMFLFEIGRWAATELKERWTISRKRKDGEYHAEVDLTEPIEVIEQKSEDLLNSVALELKPEEVERVLKIVERKRVLILEWKEMKVDNDEEYNRQMISRSTLRLRQAELDQRITSTLIEIGDTLKEWGVEVIRTPM